MYLDEGVSDAASDLLGSAGMELVRLYTGSALELNAYDVAAKGYAVRKDDFILSTIQNVPDELRLPLEIDEGKQRDELVDHYRTEALRRTCEDYLVRSVSVVDACVEEVYAVCLESCSPGLSVKRREREVRSAWAANDEGRTSLVGYLVDEAGLCAPPGKESTVDMVFDRYCEIREVRHALVHNGGVLSSKNKVRLEQLRCRLPEDNREGSIASAKFLNNGVVEMSLHEMLAFRQWFYTAILGFLREAFIYSANQNGNATTGRGHP